MQRRKAKTGKPQQITEDWLESIVPGLSQTTKKEQAFTEELFLTELFSEEELKRVVLPFGNRKMLWDLLTLSLVLYTALVLPYILCMREGSAPGWTRWVDLVSDFVFLIDIFLNFHTAVVTGEQDLIIRKGELARRYLLGWFPIDASGSVPWEIIILLMQVFAGGGSMGSDLGSMQIVKILKIPKLLRLGRLLKIVSRLAEGASNVGRIGFLILSLCILCHWFSCIFFLISSPPGGAVFRKICDPEFSYYTYAPEAPPTPTTPLNPTASSQLASQPASPAAAAEPKSVYECATDIVVYLVTYKATLLMIMGDGEDGQNAGELAFSVAVMVVGACVNAIIFANVASLVAQLSATSAAHNAHMDAVNRAMKKLKLDYKTASRVRGYFHYSWVKHEDHAGDMFISSLPYALRSRTSCQVHEKHIRACPLFLDVDRTFVAAISTVLEPEVYLPAQFVLVAGNVSRAMYFVHRGSLQSIQKQPGCDDDNPKFDIAPCNECFNVLGLFSNRFVRHSVRSISHVDLYKLPRAPFTETIKDYPCEALTVADAATSRMPHEEGALISQCIYETVGILPKARAMVKEKLSKRRRWGKMKMTTPELLSRVRDRKSVV